MRTIKITDLVNLGFDDLVGLVETGFESLPLWWSAFKAENKDANFVFPVNRETREIWLEMDKGRVKRAAFRDVLENNLAALAS